MSTSTSSALEGDEEEKPIIRVENIHKTYLLGIEGIAALRFFVFLFLLHHPYFI